MANKKPSEKELELFRKRVADKDTPKEAKAMFQKILDEWDNVGDVFGEDDEKFQEEVQKAKPKKTPPGPVEKKKKPTPKAKPKTKRKPRTAKKTPTKSEYEQAMADLKKKSGKTEEECLKIIEDYRALRKKSQERKKKETETKKVAKKRTEKLKKEDKVTPSGTKKPDVVIEDATPKVEERVEEKIEQIKKENTPKPTKEEPKPKPTPKQEEKIEKEVKKVAKESLDATQEMIKAIMQSLSAFDKVVAKAELIKLRDALTKEINKMAWGGLTDGATANMNITNSQMSAESVNPQMYAKGGKMARGGEIYDLRISLGEYGHLSQDDAKSNVIRDVFLENNGKVDKNKWDKTIKARPQWKDSWEDFKEFSEIEVENGSYINPYQYQYAKGGDIYGEKYAESFKKGDMVYVSGEAVFDGTSGKSTTTTGKIVSDLDIATAKGYTPTQYNYFYQVKLDDGNIIGVNAHEISKTKKSFAKGGSTKSMEVDEVMQDHFANGGRVNKEFLANQTSDYTNRILKSIANYYGTTTSKIREELFDKDAEMIYEYIGNDSGLRRMVYEQMENFKNRSNYKKGGKTPNWVQKVENSSKFDKGAFGNKAKKRGMTTRDFMNEVLSNPSMFTMKTRRQAQYMKNAYN
jgi:chemotaxis protein histidine kinase CheA